MQTVRASLFLEIRINHRTYYFLFVFCWCSSNVRTYDRHATHLHSTFLIRIRLYTYIVCVYQAFDLFVFLKCAIENIYIVFVLYIYICIYVTTVKHSPFLTVREREKERERVCVCVCPSPPPPFIFIFFPILNENLWWKK